jgi:hypothetical protein
MSILDLFNQVEARLKQIAESLEQVREVTISEPALEHGFKTPRVFVWIREGESAPVTISGDKRRHVWKFEYVIDVVAADPSRAYEQVKSIAWELYNRVMDDRTLGGLVLRADPASRFLRVEAPSERAYVHRWIMEVTVIVER